MFYRRCFFFIFSPRFLRDPLTDRPETLQHDRKLAEFYKLTSKIRGALPLQKLGAKNMQNVGQFWTTSNFDREYLRNGSRYPKLDDATNYGCVSWKKSGELWSTNGLELHVSLDPLKCTYLGNYISAHRGFCAVIFLHALEIDQALLAHTPTGTGVPQNFLIMKI